MTINFMQVTPDEAVETMIHLFSHPETRGLVPLLHGKPGEGKSHSVRAVAAALGAMLIEEQLLQRDRASLRGLEAIDQATMTTVHCRPEFLPPYSDDPDAPLYLLFFDELLGAHDLVRRPALELLLEKKIGPHRVGPNVLMVAAGNTLEGGTQVYELDTAEANRFIHLHVVTQWQGWAEWARRNDVHPVIIRFVEDNPGLFSAEARDIAAGNLAFQTGRTFVFASNILKTDPPRRIRDIALHGALGEKVADVLIRQLDDEAARFDLQALLRADRADRVYPTSPYGQFMLARNLDAFIVDPETLERAFDVMMDMPDDLCPGVAECKMNFIAVVLPKIKAWKLTARYALDPRYRRYREASAALLRGADAGS